MESYKKKVNLGNQEIILESGKVARQATGSVVATCGNTQILATVVVGRPPGEHQDFFPSRAIRALFILKFRRWKKTKMSMI